VKSFIERERESRYQFAADVRQSLMLDPRQIPSRYFYDALGSALFEAICRLPWYGITRAEKALLAAHAADIIDPRAPVARVVELGPGNGEKLATLLKASRRPPSGVEVHLVDASATAITASSRTLMALPDVDVVGHEASYEEGLRRAVQDGRRVGGQTLVLFLGSNIGNFDRDEADTLLHRIRETVTSGDSFLIGVDLIKPEKDLLLAYDDPLGVTAAFNLNLLCRVNRELGGDFDPRRFSHRAVWNPELSRIEMHVVSEIRQRVRIPGADLDFIMQGGESIWTESSYKFQPIDIAAALERTGFSVVQQWVDANPGVALTLARAT
jgi:dimethylhistidine N-methyltransferase